MPSWGSGLAHALTQGVVGGLEGQEDRQRKLIVLAAQKRAEQRAMEQDRLGKEKFAHEVEQDRINNMINGYTEGEALITPATTPDTGEDPLNKTFNEQLNQGLGGFTHPGSQSALTKPIAPGSLGQIPQYDVTTTPEGFDYARSKQGQQRAEIDTAAMERKLADIEAKRELAAGNMQLRRELAAQADQLRRDLAAMRGEVGTNWQTVTTADGSMVQVNPKTGETRPIGLQGAGGGTLGSRMAGVQIRKAAAANRAQIATIDKAIRETEMSKDAFGLKRGLGLVPGMGELAGQVNQRVDKAGEPARNALQNATSITIVNRAGKALTKTELATLGFLPNVASTKEANLQKLRDLKEYVETETAELERTGGAPVATAEPDGTASPPPQPQTIPRNPPRSVSVEPLTPQGGLSDADLWEQYVSEGMSKAQATQKVKQRRRQ
jgi:hypothetical protein